MLKNYYEYEFIIKYYRHKYKILENEIINFKQEIVYLKKKNIDNKIAWNVEKLLWLKK